jgi:predicted unusual protein kinase regulating ubiquinone biosynthesis (AarF/ABC1/UbiB family)
MEFVKGKKISDLTPFARLELDGRILAQDLFKAYLDQVLSDGFFHADPHPGNIFITEDKKLALIDLGMVAQVDSEVRENLLKLLLYMVEGKGLDAARISLKMGIQMEGGNEDLYLKEIADFISEYQNEIIDNIQIGHMILNLTKIAAKNKIKISSDLTLLGKTLLSLDEITKTLEPDFKPNEEIKNHIENLFRKQMFKSLSIRNVFSSLLEINEFVQKLPARLNSLLDTLTKNRFEFKIDAFDEVELMHSLQKIANRITLGLILAALIVGAALMMQVKTAFTIFGYPGLAIIFFIFAAIGAFLLIINILKEKLSKK